MRFGSFQDKVVVVTGGASGIGLGLVERFVAEGAHVCTADIDESGLRVLEERLGVFGMRADLGDSGAVRSFARAVDERYGRADVVINNAGVGSLATFSRLTQGEFEWVIRINLMGIVYGTLEFLPLLQKHGGEAHLVNTASIGTMINAKGMAAYGAAKGGVISMTESLDRELLEMDGDVRASAFIPAKVTSRLDKSARSAPVNVTPVPIDESLLPPGREISPGEAAEAMIRGIRSGRRYIATHAETLEWVQARHREVEESFAEYE